MERFLTLLQSFSTENTARGRQFEGLCKWLLKNHPLYRSKLKKIWLWNDWPSRWGRDCGIDLVAEDTDGQIWAIQAKCYAPQYSVTKQDVDSFLSESSNSKIHHRLLIATTDGMGANAKGVIRRQNATKPIYQMMLSDLLEAPIEWPHSIDELSSATVKKCFTPKPYQQIAIDKVVENLDSRGQLIMACGTGKTLTGLWIAEKLKAETTLVLLPSLLLLSKTLAEWLTHSKVQFHYLPVCSDDTAAKSEDTISLSTSDLSFPSTTDAGEIANFIRSPGKKVIFSTYQSSEKIAQAFKLNDLSPVDFIIADEAHRCAGKAGSAYSTVLHNEQIPAVKRLFMTATPKLFKAHLVKRATESGTSIISMDDQLVFGPVLHKLSFAEAIEQNLLTDYQVVIVGIDNSQYSEMIARRTFIATETNIQSDAQSFANHIGLAKAIKTYDLNRIISFHSRVNSAADFAKELPNVIDWMPEASRPSGQLIANYISGSMPTSERNRKLKSLGDMVVGQRYVLANARCLSEGIDIPALDGVAFIDPKSSEIDIIQAVGRAIRLSSAKSLGTILIPVFIEDHQNPDEALNSSQFKTVWTVVNALRSHDEALGQQLDELRREIGKQGTVGASDKIIFDLPTTITHHFENALAAKTITSTTSPWEFWFGLLENYKKEFGDCLVPADYITSSNFKLGNWVGTQRYSKNELVPERIERLDGLGFVWDARASHWEEAFQELMAYKNEFGDCLVAGDYISPSGLKLGNWVSIQRLNNKQSEITAERMQRLNSIGFVWDAINEKWEQGYQELLSYKKDNGDCLVPQGHITPSGYPLGNWVGSRRQTKNQLTLEKIKLLDALNFSWNTRDEQWERGFNELEAYHKEFGDFKITDGFVTLSGFNLSGWVREQRHGKSITPERIKRLDTLGFIWDPYSKFWEDGFHELTNYKKEFGDCLVVRSYISPSGYKLGAWVGRQKSNRSDLTPHQDKLLSSLGLFWGDESVRFWEQGFSELKAYRKDNGDCLVPQSHITASGFKLGTWLSNQRFRKENMSSDQIKRLTDLGAWSKVKDTWTRGFRELIAYQKEYGDCLVPSDYITSSNFKLGNWVENHRSKRKQLALEYIECLDTLGFAWDVLKDTWTRGFRELIAYQKEYGDCLVPSDYITSSNFKLGHWVENHRSKRKHLALEYIECLDTLGFTWDVLEENWKKAFDELVAYKNQFGNCLVPQLHSTSSGFKLGRWIHKQKQRYTQGNLEKARFHRLNELGVFWGNARELEFERHWKTGVDELITYKKKFGDCLVVGSYISPSGFKLGQWIQSKRNRQNDLSLEQIQDLDTLGFFWGNVDDAKWEEGFNALETYKKEFGDCWVNSLYTTPSGYSLGTWVQSKRTSKSNLAAEYINRLDALGFIWDPRADKWEKGFQELILYKTTFADLLVAGLYNSPSGFGLGKWVNRQRTHKERLSQEQVKRLEDLGFVWDVLQYQWDKGFQELVIYKREFGDCLVVRSYISLSGFKLAAWVSKQRSTKENMPSDRIKRLDDLGFVWKVKK
ncbi:Helicase associated domain protein [Porticoccaceae bacterium]|nr:Helicase associated domain protein [Porticoccaceae bacterium]